MIRVFNGPPVADVISLSFPSNQKPVTTAPPDPTNRTGQDVADHRSSPRVVVYTVQSRETNPKAEKLVNGN